MAKNLAERHSRFPQLKLSESLVDNLFDVLVNQLDGTQGIHHVEAIRFHARDVNLVMGPAERGLSVPFRVLIDGEPPEAAHGTDVDERGNGTVAEQRLYQLIRQPKPISDRAVEIEFLDPGVAVFAFTFG